MKNNDRIILQGEVIDSCKNIFRVKISEDHIVSATLSGKIRQNDIRILTGDKVSVEVSEYDLTRGRILTRFKEKKN